MGRYVVNRLGNNNNIKIYTKDVNYTTYTAQQGTQVVVAYRDPDEVRHLKVCGDLGQVIPLEFDLRNKEQLVECVRHSDIVYNLVGRDYETK